MWLFDPTADTTVHGTATSALVSGCGFAAGVLAVRAAVGDLIFKGLCAS
jgi:hypothetical protein